MTLGHHNNHPTPVPAGYGAGTAGAIPPPRKLSSSLFRMVLEARTPFFVVMRDLLCRPLQRTLPLLTHQEEVSLARVSFVLTILRNEDFQKSTKI